MRSLLRYLINNYAFLLFLLLEVVSIVLIVNYNNYQKVTALNSSNRIVGGIYNSFNSVVNYFELAEINRTLAEENARLKFQNSKNPVSVILNSNDSTQHNTPTSIQYTSARIINNSVNKPYNYITLNKGSKHGIKPDQGIICPDGIVGVVTKVSEKYSTGFSVLNMRWGISAKLKKSNAFGSLNWKGGNYRTAELNEIPFHVNITEGDTIVTSSYSYIFPEGIMIGTIQSFSKPEGENYYNIKVKLATDFKSLSFVEVINNKDKVEIKELETEMTDDESSN